MTRDLNKVIIIGRLGRDPEMHHTSSGHPRTKFSVATSRTWTTQDGERRSETEWFTVVAWDRLAEICNQYLNKGYRVYVEGRLQTRKWQDTNGIRHTTTEIIASEMLILTDRQGNNQEDLKDIQDYEGIEEPEDEELDEFPF